jgi:hypothetical protein
MHSPFNAWIYLSINVYPMLNSSSHSSFKGEYKIEWFTFGVPFLQGVVNEHAINMP